VRSSGCRAACGDVLREEELELLVCELAQLGAEHIVDADVVCISPATAAGSASGARGQVGEHERLRRRCSAWGFGGQSCNSRKIGHCQRRVRVEVVRLYEALKKIPTHLGRLIGALRREAREEESFNAREGASWKWGNVNVSNRVQRSSPSPPHHPLRTLKVTLRLLQSHYIHSASYFYSVLQLVLNAVCPPICF
jgi:hypothetical protein